MVTGNNYIKDVETAKANKVQGFIVKPYNKLKIMGAVETFIAQKKDNRYMTDSLDLANLRSMTDGDKELEIALFQEFYSSTEASLETMAANCTDGQNEIWQTTAHALKGTCYNLGAQVMGDLFKKAQESSAVSSADKKALLDLIRSEYTKVKALLEKIHT